MIEIVGVIGLLIVFEFINLVIHPYLVNFTNDSPLLMLLILVLIAAVIVPMHHKLEQWVKHRLVEKNKAVRLAAAKRTIEKTGGREMSQGEGIQKVRKSQDSRKLTKKSEVAECPMLRQAQHLTKKIRVIKRTHRTLKTQNCPKGIH